MSRALFPLPSTPARESFSFHLLAQHGHTSATVSPPPATYSTHFKCVCASKSVVNRIARCAMETSFVAIIVDSRVLSHHPLYQPPATTRERSDDDEWEKTGIHKGEGKQTPHVASSPARRLAQQIFLRNMRAALARLPDLIGDNTAVLAISTSGSSGAQLWLPSLESEKKKIALMLNHHHREENAESKDRAAGAQDSRPDDGPAGDCCGKDRPRRKQRMTVHEIVKAERKREGDTERERKGGRSSSSAVSSVHDSPLLGGGRRKLMSRRRFLQRAMVSRARALYSVSFSSNCGLLFSALSYARISPFCPCSSNPLCTGPKGASMYAIF